MARLLHVNGSMSDTIYGPDPNSNPYILRNPIRDRFVQQPTVPETSESEKAAISYQRNAVPAIKDIEAGIQRDENGVIKLAPFNFDLYLFTVLTCNPEPLKTIGLTTEDSHRLGYELVSRTDAGHRFLAGAFATLFFKAYTMAGTKSMSALVAQLDLLASENGIPAGSDYFRGLDAPTATKMVERLEAFMTTHYAMMCCFSKVLVQNQKLVETVNELTMALALANEVLRSIAESRKEATPESTISATTDADSGDENDSEEEDDEDYVCPGCFLCGFDDDDEDEEEDLCEETDSCECKFCADSENEPDDEESDVEDDIVTETNIPAPSFGRYVDIGQ